MEVTFFRHGVAVDRADPLAPVDFERPLTIDGKNRAEVAARGLRSLVERPRLVLSSPYKRCVQTARLVSQVLGLSKSAVRELDALRPDAEPHTLWPELALLGHESVVCVSHGGAIEPMSAVALGLAPPRPAGRDADGDARDASGDGDDGGAAIMRTLHLKKAGALLLDVTFAPTLSATLQWLVTPKILRALGRP